MLTRGGSACIQRSCPDVQCVLKTSQQRRETGEPCVILTVTVPPQEGQEKQRCWDFVFSHQRRTQYPPCPSGLHGETDWKVVLVGLGAHSFCDSDHPQTASWLCSQLFSELCLWLQDHTSQSPSGLDLTYWVCVSVCVCVCFNLILYCPSSLDFPKLEDQHTDIFGKLRF